MSGCSSGVEHNLAKVGVGRSNRLTRSSFSQHERILSRNKTSFVIPMQSNLTRRTFNAAVLAGFASGLVGRLAAPAAADPLTLLDFAIAGGHYHGLAATMSDLIAGDRLELRREADNPHDRNAIAVYRASVKLGYIPRAVNTPLAALMDAGRQIRADVVGFIDGREGNQDQLAFTSFSSGDPKIRLFLEAQSTPKST